MACRCATVPRMVPPLSSSLFWFFNLSSILFFSLFVSLFLSVSLVFQHLFASFFSLLLSFVRLSSTSRVFSCFSRNFSRHPSYFLHRDHSPTHQTGLNLRPINLDKLNERRPAFDARVNHEYFSVPFGSSHSTRMFSFCSSNLSDGRIWLRSAGEVIEKKYIENVVLKTT